MAKIKFEVWLRAFAPFDWFGAEGWSGEGDNRRFSCSKSAKHKIRGICQYEIDDKGNVSFINAIEKGAISHFRAGGSAESEAHQKIYKRNPLDYHVYGNNDALAGDYSPTWDIDLHLYLSISTHLLSDGTYNLVFSGNVKGDQFPSAEIFAIDSFGIGVFLDTFTARHGPNEGPFVALAGDKKKAMMSIGSLVNVDSSGKFLKVRNYTSLLNPTSSLMFDIPIWNTGFERRNPKIQSPPIKKPAIIRQR